MKRMFLMVLIPVCCTLLLSSVGIAQIKLDALPFKSRTIGYYEDGAIKKGKLEKPAEIDGFLCRDWVHFHPNGMLKQFRIAATTTVLGVGIPAKSWVFLDDQGRLAHCWLSEDVVINGVQCVGGSGKVDTAFYPDGRLRACFPRADVVIRGIPCCSDLFHPVYFHENGALRSCKLADSVEIDDSAYSKNAVITLDQKGKVLASKPGSYFEDHVLRPLKGLFRWLS